MAEWKKKTFPKCPKCSREGTWVGHKECPQNGKMWIDIQTGTVKCNGCGDSWSLENTENHCSCGAIFKGGEIWKGMALDVKRYRHLVWLQRLGISKGSLQTEFIRWSKKKRALNIAGRTARTFAKGVVALTILGALLPDNREKKNP